MSRTRWMWEDKKQSSWQRQKLWTTKTTVEVEEVAAVLALPSQTRMVIVSEQLEKTRDKKTCLWRRM